MSDYSQPSPHNLCSLLRVVNSTVDRPDTSQEFQASDRKRVILLLRVAECRIWSDYFVMATVIPTVRAISEAIEDKVEQEWQRRPCGLKGTWVLQDYGDGSS